MDVHDIDKNFIREQYIHSREWVILMEPGKTLINENFQEPMQKYLVNISYGMLTLEQTCESAFSNDAL